MNYGNIVGTEVDDRLIQQARLVRECSGLHYDIRRMSVYDIANLESKFDIILFMGVLYHLRYPLLALDQLRKIAGGIMFVQCNVCGSDADFSPPDNIRLEELPTLTETRGFPVAHFIEKAYGYGDSTNWWIPNASCLKAMLRSSGFEIVEEIEKGFMVCR